MLSHFSHIYYESAAIQNPTGRHILNKFPKARLIEISDYKDIFNRKRQDWRLQKDSLKMILALKKSEFYYPGSDVTPDFNQKNFYYNTLIMNCIYDCHYCYLQGMYPSSNVVVFTNIEDYFSETDKLIQAKGSLYLSISYDTDLLAFENIVPYCRQWLEYAHARKNLKIELRTKSANFNSIKSLSPSDNFILAWTISPESIIKKYETKTPGLKARLESAVRAIEAGWKVRLCIDPIIISDSWESEYDELIKTVKSALPFSEVYDISLGTFRMNKDYYQKTKDLRPDSELLHFPFKINGKMAGYDKDVKMEVLGVMKEKLSGLISENKIFTI